MEWFQLLFIIAIVFSLVAFLIVLQIWNRFRQLKLGDKLSEELVNEVRKKIRILIILLGMGVVIYLVGIIIRP